MTILPLSKAQLRVWLESQAMPESAAYNNPLCYHLLGDVNVERIKQVLQEIVDRQPALRGYFVPQGGIPKQVLTTELKVNFEFYDLSISLDKQESRMKDIIQNNVSKSFHLTELPLHRFTLIKLNENNFYLILNIHHIVVDGYSAGLLIKAISEGYQQTHLNSAALDDMYMDHLQQPSNNQKLSQEFWAQQFQNMKVNIDLFSEFSKDISTDRGIRQHFAISSELSQQLKKIAKINRTTDFIVLMAAFYVVLAKYADQYDLTIGYAVDTRTADSKNLFGFFVNNIPLRLQFTRDDTFTDILQRLTRLRKTIKPHQSLDYMDILQAVRDINKNMQNTLFDVSFIRANFAMTGLDLPHIEVKPIPLFTGAVKDDLSLLYDETQDNFEFEIEYRANKYHSQYISEIIKSFQACLAFIANHRDAKIKEIEIFPRKPETNIKLENNTDINSVIERFIQHAAGYPEKIAVITEQDTLTYQELYLHVIHLVKYLYSEQMTGEQPVIVHLERTPELLAVFLALQWLGIPYIPVDTNTPMKRLEIIVEESQCSAMITAAENLPLACRIIHLANLQTTDSMLPNPIKDKIAYIIYTSGSTGKPKGVVIHQHALHNFLKAMEEKFSLSPHNILLAITTVAFDISILELLLPIWTGTTLYLANQKQHKDPFAISLILDRHPITMLQATPAMWNMLFDAGWTGNKKLIALSGGEALSPSLTARLLPSVSELWNMYGPTEATIWCALKKIETIEKISVGQPISNMQMFVLDEEQNTLPPCVKGDLYLAGRGLAEGYLHRPDLTAAQFNYHEKLNLRLYKTGDVACVNLQGDFHIYGRKDNQIKLHGYRIELSEIEVQLESICNIRQAFVVLHEHQLFAYLITDAVINKNELDTQLRKILPEYMLPKCYISLDKFPLTNSGKIDKKALPIHEIKMVTDIVAPETAIEQTLKKVWTDILKNANISVTENFFYCGGHSLLATQIISILANQYQLHLTFSEFLSYPTIRSAARYLENLTKEKIISIAPIQQTQYPLTEAQQRFWFLAQLQRDNAGLNMAGYLHIQGHFDKTRFEKALVTLSHKHAILRCRISMMNGVPYQQPMNDFIIPISYLKQEELIPWAKAPFLVQESVLWRVGIVEMSHNEFWLGFSFHHIICDGMSVAIFMKDFFDAYHHTLTLSEAISYFDYAFFEKQKGIDQTKIDFWKKALLSYHYLQLPTDSPREHTSNESDRINWHIDLDKWSKIRHFCKEEKISINTYCVAILALCLQKITTQNDFCIGMPYANREYPETENLVGCFMNIVPLRIMLPSNISYKKWLQQLHAHIQQIIYNGNVSLAKILQVLPHAREFQSTPIFNIMLNIQPDIFSDINTSEWNFQFHPIHSFISDYELNIDLYFSEQRLWGAFEYNKSLFTLQRVEEWCQTYQDLLIDFIDMVNSEMLYTQSAIVEAVHIKKPITDVRPLATAMQKQVAKHWKAHLEIENIYLRDNYFSLGGHSLMATRLIASLNKELNLTIPLETIFKYPVLEDFCGEISHFKQNENVFEKHELLQLTPNQLQLALLSEEENIEDMYHLGVLVLCPHAMDIHELILAIQTMLEQHDVYRLQISKKHAEMADDVKSRVEVITTANHEETKAHAKLLNAKAFNLNEAPLARFVIFKENVNKIYLLITMHHLISDEWSLELCVKEIFKLESHSSSWAKHHARWLHEQTASLDYWKNYLAESSTTTIPYTKRFSGEKGLARKIHATFSSKKILSICEKIGVSSYIVTLAAYCVLLKYFCNGNRIYLATAYDRRKTVELQTMQGYCINLLPIDMDFDKAMTLQDFIILLNEDRIRSMEHADVDFARLLEKGLAPKPALIFNFQHSYQVIKQSQSLHWQEISGNQAKFPFILQIRNSSDGMIECAIEYNGTLYDESFIQLALEAYREILSLLPANLNTNINELQITNKTCIVDNDYIHAKMPQKTFIEILRKKTLQSTCTALKYADNQISYQDLWRKVDAFAERIKTQHHESLQNQAIGVFLSNSEEYVITILAILTLSATFIPIDESLPMQRKEQILKDASAILLITKNQIEKLPNPSLQKSYAYIIYTSGTTGVPKGVGITQQQLYFFIDALHKKLGIRENDHILQFAAISFDASIWEIFLALYAGATLFIPEEKSVGMRLQNFMQKHKITHTILTPSVLQTLDPNALPFLRSVASGGEACTRTLVERWANKVDFYNAYGPTEATVCTNMQKMSVYSKPEIVGEAFGKAQLQIVSPDLNPLPKGAIGELLIAGENITEGYIQQPDMNAKQFIVLSGTRWYRTGDYMRLRADDKFEYFGRVDKQVKLRGLRIELNEIGTVLQQQLFVEQAICQIHDEQIIAYIVASNKIDSLEFTNQLSKQLPGYMIPHHIMQIESIPLLPSGKIHVSALPLPNLVSTLHRGPMDETEKKVYSIWKKHMNLEDFSMEEDFFALGGNSLQAMQISAEIEELFTVNMSMHEFYQYPSVSKQNRYIQESQFDI